MANHFSHASLPYPIRNARYTLLVPYLDSTGTPTDPTTPDTEVSKDAGSFADCAEEVSTITGSNGEGYITLTGAETDCVLLGFAAKVASGPKATLATLYPRTLPIISSGTLAAGSAGGGTLASAIGYDLTGCFIRTTGGTGGGGTGGANNQARKMITYTQSTGAFTVAPNWETTPSTDTTYDVLLPEGAVFGAVKAVNPTTAGRTLDVSTGGEAGVDWANVGSPTTTLNLSGTSTKAVEPTVAGRTLDVSAGGEAGLDWANVGSPSTTVSLSGTTVATVTTAGALGSTAKTDVNTEVSNALGVTTITEQAQGAPPASPTMKQVMSYLYMLFVRNKKALDASGSPAVESIYSNDDTTVAFKRNVTNSGSVTTAAKTVSG